MRSRAFWSALASVAVCACASGEARAQLPGDVRTTPLSGSQILLPYTAPAMMAGGPPFGPVVRPGPRVAVGVGVGFGYYPWYGYPGFGYPGFGFPWYSGRAGSVWSNGLSLYGPPIPVPGSIPGVFGNGDLVEQWRNTLWPGFAGGWVGVGVSVSPRPPISFGPSIPTVEGVHRPPGPPPRIAKIGGVLIISVKVPQPAAEVLVDGRRTTQTGTDRIFESPPLEAGTTPRYTVTARWVERGRIFEASREVSGTPGEVVRVDFTVP